MKIPKVEFAPLNVPLERRLQTLAVTFYIVVSVFASPACWCITFYALIYGDDWLRLLVIAYLLFVYHERDKGVKGGRSKRTCLRFMNSLWWRFFCDYFPIKLIKTVDIDPSRNYLFCSFPHGILASGVTGAFATNAIDTAKIFPGLDFRIVTLDQHFHTPFFREYILSLGLCSCTESSINYLLSTKPPEADCIPGNPLQGRAVVLIVGGAAEALKCKPYTYNILLKRRRGFVRMALINGTPLVPVISFGETDIYDQMSNPRGSKLRKFQESVKKYTRIAPIFPMGRGVFQYTFGIIPFRRPISVVVGAPVEVPKIENPTNEQIDEYHAKFTEKIIELFETEKSKYIENYKTTSLILDDC